MHPSFFTGLAAFFLLSGSAFAQSPGPYTLRSDLATAKAIPEVIARSAHLPLSKRYQDMTETERDVIRGFYTAMAPNDEPPFPKHGLGLIVKSLYAAQSRLLVSGSLYLVVDISSEGNATSVTAYGSPSPEMTKFAASLMLLTKYKPALCSGRPCAEKFPFSLAFEVQ